MGKTTTVADVSVVLPGERERVWLYGPDNCARYAASETPPLLATVNADSYTWMATSMYFRKHWPQAFDGGQQTAYQPAPQAGGPSNTTATINPSERDHERKSNSTAGATGPTRRALRRLGDGSRSAKFRRSSPRRLIFLDEDFSFSRPQDC